MSKSLKKFSSHLISTIILLFFLLLFFSLANYFSSYFSFLFKFLILFLFVENFIFQLTSFFFQKKKEPKRKKKKTKNNFNLQALRFHHSISYLYRWTFGKNWPLIVIKLFTKRIQCIISFILIFYLMHSHGIFVLIFDQHWKFHFYWQYWTFFFFFFV